MRFVKDMIRAFRASSYLLAVAAVLGGCAEGFLPASSATSPSELTVTAVRLDAIRLTWKRVEGDVVSYVIERRTDFIGPFKEVAQIASPGIALAFWIDADVRAETYYGYRVYAITSAGDRSSPSVIGGARTPPPQGIDIVTSSQVTVTDAFDPDGYEVLVAGPDTVRASLGVAGTRRISPLRPGRYTVTRSEERRVGKECRSRWWPYH